MTILFRSPLLVKKIRDIEIEEVKMGDITKEHPLQSFLTGNPTIDLIRFQFMDMSSVLRVRVVTKAWALSLALRGAGVGIVSPILTAMGVSRQAFWENIEAGTFLLDLEEGKVVNI